MKINQSLALLSIMLGITILSGIVLSSSFVSADDIVDQINIEVPVSCSLSGTGMNTHNATIINGTVNSSIGETTMKVYCNDTGGFAIYAIGYTDNEDGKNVLTNSTLGPTHDIVTGTNTAPVGEVDTSNWAMKLTTITDPTPTYPLTIENNFNNFHTVPDDYTLVAKRTSNTDIGASAEGSALISTYQAYISKTQPAGTYTGQVKYTLVHPNDGVAPTVPISIEKAYEKNGKQKYNGYYKMQDMSDTICDAVTIYDETSETQLIDARDNKTYYVAKLQDGNCWMTQNLDHDIVTDGSVAYNNTTTDLGWNGTSYSTASWTPSSATKATSDTTWTTGDAGNTIPQSYDPGELYWNGIIPPKDQQSCEAAGGTWVDEYGYGYYDCKNVDFTSSTGNPHYHLGNYYDWTAAVALNDSSSYSTSGDSIDQSICPTNWKLSDYLEFENLITQYGFNSSSFEMVDPYIWETPIKVFSSGDWYGSLSGLSSTGAILHSSVYSSQLVYGSAIYDGIILPGYTMNRNTGYSVRCVAR